MPIILQRERDCLFLSQVGLSVCQLNITLDFAFPTTLNSHMNEGILALILNCKTEESTPHQLNVFFHPDITH